MASTASDWVGNVRMRLEALGNPSDIPTYGDDEPDEEPSIVRYEPFVEMPVVLTPSTEGGSATSTVVLPTSNATPTSSRVEFVLNAPDAAFCGGEIVLRFRVGFGAAGQAATKGEYLVDDFAARCLQTVELLQAGQVKWSMPGEMIAESKLHLDAESRTAWDQYCQGGYGSSGKRSIADRQRFTHVTGSSFPGARYIYLRLLKHPFEGKNHPLYFNSLSPAPVLRFTFKTYWELVDCAPVLFTSYNGGSNIAAPDYNAIRTAGSYGTSGDLYLSDFTLQLESVMMPFDKQQRHIERAFNEGLLSKCTSWYTEQWVQSAPAGGPSNLIEVEPRNHRGPAYALIVKARYAKFLVHQTSSTATNDVGIAPDECIPIEAFSITSVGRQITPTMTSRGKSGNWGARVPAACNNLATQNPTPLLAYPSIFPWVTPGRIKSLYMLFCDKEDYHASHRNYLGQFTLSTLQNPRLRIQLPAGCANGSDDPFLYRAPPSASSESIVITTISEVHNEITQKQGKLLYRLEPQ